MVLMFLQKFEGSQHFSLLQQLKFNFWYPDYFFGYLLGSNRIHFSHYLITQSNGSHILNLK